MAAAFRAILQSTLAYIGNPARHAAESYFFRNFAVVIMTRVFHHRLTLGELCGIILVAAASLYCFLFGTLPMAVLGALLMVAAVRGIDRGIHTDYVLSDDHLATKRGRLGKRGGQPIELERVTAVRRMPRHLLTGSYVLVEHGDGRIDTFTPENEQSFVDALCKRVRQKKDNA